jgi:hypothetical protein
MTSDELLRLLWDPTAPLPGSWPVGALGAFLLFLVPIGGGIPLGVLIARDGGVSPIVTALLYMASDVVIAVFAEPWLAFLRWLGRHIAIVGRIGGRLSSLSGGAGLKDSGARGPLGLILVSFTTSPTMGRAATQAAGHGFLTGWALAIAGDMLYFVLVMASTLWISGVFGDERLTIGTVLVATWVLPVLLRRLRRARASAQPAVSPRLPLATAYVPSANAADVSTDRSTRRPVARRANRSASSSRRPRGLHR